jgi:hypothetical protein
MKNAEEIPAGYLRVTSVLEPFSNLKSIDPQVLARAADRGRRVHDYCEAYASNLFIGEVDNDCKNYFDAFCIWFDETVTSVKFLETRCNSPTFRISGKPDMIATLKGSDDLCLIDYKTPQTEAKSWCLQTAAYQIITTECLDVECTRRIALMLPKTGKQVKTYEYENHSSDRQKFINALELYRHFF